MRETAIETGRVRGIACGWPSITAFYGIPYAAPPVGELRCFTCMAERPTTGTRRCTVNPVIGREIEGTEVTPAAVKKRVVVVGGGLAGCECAVHLVEMRDALAVDCNIRTGPSSCRKWTSSPLYTWSTPPTPAARYGIHSLVYCLQTGRLKSGVIGPS